MFLCRQQSDHRRRWKLLQRRSRAVTPLQRGVMIIIGALKELIAAWPAACTRVGYVGGGNISVSMPKPLYRS